MVTNIRLKIEIYLEKKKTSHKKIVIFFSKEDEEEEEEVFSLNVNRKKMIPERTNILLSTNFSKLKVLFELTNRKMH